MNIGEIRETLERAVRFLEEEYFEIEDIEFSSTVLRSFDLGEFGEQKAEIEVEGYTNERLDAAQTWDADCEVSVKDLRGLVDALAEFPETLDPGFVIPSTADPEVARESTLPPPDSIEGANYYDPLTVPTSSTSRKVRASEWIVGERIPAYGRFIGLFNDKAYYVSEQGRTKFVPSDRSTLFSSPPIVPEGQVPIPYYDPLTVPLGEAETTTNSTLKIGDDVRGETFGRVVGKVAGTAARWILDRNGRRRVISEELEENNRRWSIYRALIPANARPLYVIDQENGSLPGQ